MTEISICCNISCPERFGCQKFSRALDVNSGKIRAGYVEVHCERFSEFEK